MARSAAGPKRLRSTAGWKISYEWTPTGRRRTLFKDLEGTVWRQTTQSRATHYRKTSLGPVYLRRA